MSHDLTLERLIEATPEEVFDAFTDPEAQEEWNQDDPNWTVDASIDLRVGGRWELSLGEPGDQPYRESSVFTEVDAPRHLAYTTTHSWPDGKRFDTDLVVTFEQRDLKTRFTLTEAGFPNEAERDHLQEGWPGFIDRLEQVVARRRA